MLSHAPRLAVAPLPGTLPARASVAGGAVRHPSPSMLNHLDACPPVARDRLGGLLLIASDCLSHRTRLGARPPGASLPLPRCCWAWWSDRVAPELALRRRWPRLSGTRTGPASESSWLPGFLALDVDRDRGQRRSVPVWCAACGPTPHQAADRCPLPKSLMARCLMASSTSTCRGPHARRSSRHTGRHACDCDPIVAPVPRLSWRSDGWSIAACHDRIGPGAISSRVSAPLGLQILKSTLP